MSGKADSGAAGSGLARSRPQADVDDADANLLIDVLRQAKLAVWVADNSDADYAIRLWNQGAERIYGFKRSEALGRNYLSLFVNPNERQQAIDSHRRIVESGEAYGWNYAADDVAKDGRTLTVLGNSFRVWDETRGRYLHAEVGIDISYLEQLSHQLDRSRQLALLHGGDARHQLKIVRALQVLNEAIASLSRPDERGLDRVVQAVGDGLRDMLLLSDALCRVWMLEEVEEPWLATGSDELPQPPRVAETDLIQKTISSNTVEVLTDGRPIVDDGDGGYHSVVTAPLHIGTEPRGVLIMFFRGAEPLSDDDRELIQPFSSYAAVAIVMAGLAREQKRQRYEETERIRHVIIESVLHTVGNEAGLAKLAADSLAEDLDGQGAALPARARRDLDQIRSSVDRLGQIMGEVMRLSVNVSEQARLRLGEVVRIVTRTVERDYYDRVVIWHDIDPALFVEASEYLLREAVGNLVRNAVQAMLDADGGGELRLSATSVERDWNGRRRHIVMLDVEDSGPGIPQDHRQRVWDSGFSTRGEGHGHGLYHTRGLVGMLGGAVELLEEQSKLGGAHFRMYLHRSAPAA
ncbi:ATP-binding protein [Phytohabitans sp. ZYX-F-186]|uniref:ATP-binding protein n=1 Tax=Phytohabitans maris TaxID=3071409 RepID=A0ABU0ZS30_9ACTN|nr:ATP-binding protein [Phytohabitans sp. ZYX-F-186]MDQ7909840.1 ATP-binding protein [Phytohabitans sp. ZYX-F-186]